MIKPDRMDVDSVNGDDFILRSDYPVKVGYWIRELQFTIPQGFVSDLASIPRFMRWYLDRASLGFLAPIFHDYLWSKKGMIVNLQGDTIQLTRFQCHLYFLLAMQLDGIGSTRSFLAFLAVVFFAPKW